MKFCPCGCIREKRHSNEHPPRPKRRRHASTVDTDASGVVRAAEPSETGFAELPSVAEPKEVAHDDPEDSASLLGQQLLAAAERGDTEDMQLLLDKVAVPSLT